MRTEDDGDDDDTIKASNVLLSERIRPSCPDLLSFIFQGYRR